MDNRIFNINGKGSELLLKALELAFFRGDSDKPTTCKSWRQCEENGLILLWWKSDNANNFPAALSAIDCLPIVEQWLKSDFAKTVKPSKWCNDLDHDGHNSVGWQVYVGDWGHVGPETAVICAIKPSYIWHGK